MNDQPLSSPPPTMPPPVPRWLWLACAVVPAPLCALAAGLHGGDALREGAAGLLAGGLLVGGLALAARFFAGRVARLAGGVTFAGLLAVGGAAFGFTGCGLFDSREGQRVPVEAYRTPPEGAMMATPAPKRARRHARPIASPSPTPVSAPAASPQG